MSDSHPAAHFSTRPAIQTTLTLNSPGDACEQDADRVSEGAILTPETKGASVGGDTVNECPNEGRLGTPSVQAKIALGMDGPGIEPPASVHHVLQSPGQPLDTETRSFMEPRFGQDFSNVRIHTDATAAASAAQMNAYAYTVGSDVVFGGGRFTPGTEQARKLIAHELTHVVQQSSRGDTGATVQRFDAGEHKGIGDVATGQRTIHLAPDMPVTYGEIVALAGDYFGDWQTLYHLAQQPGITAGTRGEIWYVILVKIRPSAQGGGSQQAETNGMGRFFDEKAKAAANSRYLHLAVDNVSHFPNPKEGDASRDPALKNIPSSSGGAGATYRANHVTALQLAAAQGSSYRSGHVPQGKGPDGLNDALMIEAFADHFLTDSFSAGHQQTERESIKEYWNRVVPDFWDNFQRWLAQAVLFELRKKGGAAAFVTPQWARENIALPQVQKATANLPALTFGDLVSGAVHDYFNKYGAQAEVGGQEVNLVGDTNLLKMGKGEHFRHVTSKSKPTFDAAVAAVQAGIDEIRQAYELGRQARFPERIPEKIFEAAGGKLFAAEKLMPKLKDDTSVVDPHQKSINWKLPSTKALLADSRLAEALALAINNYSDRVTTILSGLSAQQAAAVNEKLIKPMGGVQTSAIHLLQDILDYHPIEGGGFDPTLLNDMNDFRQGFSR